MVLNYRWNWNLSEVAISVAKVSPIGLYAWGAIGSFKDEICTMGYVSQLNWNGRTYIRGGKVKHELRVQICEVRVQISELLVQIHEVRVQIHNLEH